MLCRCDAQKVGCELTAKSLQDMAAENYEELWDKMRDAWGHSHAAVKLDILEAFLRGQQQLKPILSLRFKLARFEADLAALAKAAGACRRGTKTVKFKSTDYCMRHDNPEPCPIGLARVKYGVDGYLEVKP